MDWREAFIKHLLTLASIEGVDFLDAGDWAPEEWAEIEKAQKEAVERWNAKNKGDA